MLLSLDNLTPEERRVLATQEGAFAVIMGYLKAERGNIPPSVFNKLAKQLHYPKQKKEDLVSLAKKIQEDKTLQSLYDKGFERKIKLDDIPDYLHEENTLLEEDVFAHVTNYLISKEDNNARLRELRKLQREGVYMRLLMEGLKKHIVDELKGMPRSKYIKTEVPEPREGDRSLVLLLADWHIGALTFNEETGGYNFNKLVGSVQDIVTQVLQLVKELDIKHLYVFHLGDVIEHVSMRNVNQAFDSEFPATKQTAKAERLIIDMLSVLSKETHVTFGMIAGNHDRFNGNKNDQIYNDNMVYVILDHLFLAQEKWGALPNVTIIDNREDTYELNVKVAGKNIKIMHGDREGKKTDVKIPKHIKDEPIDFLILGHIHTNRIIQEDYARFHVYVGSPMGGNNYSKENNLPTTQGSQMVMVLTEGSDTPYFIPLMLDKEGKVS